MYLMIHFYVENWKKILYLKSFFKFDIYFFSTGTAPTNKLDDGIPVAHF